MELDAPGQIVIFNGAPRAGKSSIVNVMQDTFEGVWMNLGVDVFARGVTPKRYQPGVGLRPGPGPAKGGDNPLLESLVPVLYFAMYESVAAHAKLGLNVIVEGGLHGAIHPTLPSDCDATARRTTRSVRRRTLRDRRDHETSQREPARPIRSRSARGPDPAPVRLWQEEVHKPGIYDPEVDTSQLSPQECADGIRRRLTNGLQAQPSTG